MIAANVTGRRLMLAVAACCYAGVFGAFYFLERPGLGIGHFFYIPLCMVALATDIGGGACAGVVACATYALAVVVAPRVPASQALTASMGIRLFTFAAVGALVGFYASRNRELVARLRDHIGRDFVTGVGNARAFDEELAKRCEAGHPFSLVLFDVDGMKPINDVHGHAFGNETLRRVGDALQDAAGTGDFVARIGGDEFALIADEVGDIARRVNLALATEHLSVTTASTSAPADGAAAADLFHKADDRLFAAKLVRANRAVVGL